MKNVVITGGTSGFGLASIKVFIRELKDDVRIISLSRSADKIEKAKKELGESASQVEFLQADVSDVNKLNQTATYISKKYGKIDCLVNNAGTIIPGGIEILKENEWDWVLKNNLSSYFYTTKAFLQLLKESNYPSIVNISSISAKKGGSSVAYSVAKAGVDMITLVSAKELAKYGIRVNAISPGIASTGFQIWNNMVSEKDYPKLLQNNVKDYPLGIGEPIDVAEMVYYLSSEKAKWITGSNILVDGGRSM